MIGCAKFELGVGLAHQYNAMGFKPIKRLPYTLFENFYALFGMNELLGHIYAVWD